MELFVHVFVLVTIAADVITHRGKYVTLHSLAARKWKYFMNEIRIHAHKIPIIFLLTVVNGIVVCVSALYV